MQERFKRRGRGKRSSVISGGEGGKRCRVDIRGVGVMGKAVATSEWGQSDN